MVHGRWSGNGTETIKDGGHYAQLTPKALLLIFRQEIDLGEIPKLTAPHAELLWGFPGERNRIKWRIIMSKNDHLNHKPDAEGIAKIERIRSAIIALETLLDEVVPASRELAVAKTNLEQVRMWAVKGAVMQYPVDEIPAA